jgi:DNA-binding XRE family transcriptional regulator
MSVEKEEVFIIDTNAFITPYRQFYPFDLAPAFWASMKKEILKQKIIVLDKIFEELTKNAKDDLSNWIKSIDKLEPLSHKNDTIIQNYRSVLIYIQNCGFYQGRALANWSNEAIADPWIISAAMANNYTVITIETGNGNLQKNQPSWNAKIPDICKHFNIKCENLFYLMRALSFKLGG